MYYNYRELLSINFAGKKISNSLLIAQVFVATKYFPNFSATAFSKWQKPLWWWKVRWVSALGQKHTWRRSPIPSRAWSVFITDFIESTRKFCIVFISSAGASFIKIVTTFDDSILVAVNTKYHWSFAFGRSARFTNSVVIRSTSEIQTAKSNGIKKSVSSQTRINW